MSTAYHTRLIHYAYAQTLSHIFFNNFFFKFHHRTIKFFYINHSESINLIEYIDMSERSKNKIITYKVSVKINGVIFVFYFDVN